MSALDLLVVLLLFLPFILLRQYLIGWKRQHFVHRDGPAIEKQYVYHGPRPEDRRPPRFPPKRPGETIVTRAKRLAAERKA